MENKSNKTSLREEIVAGLQKAEEQKENGKLKEAVDTLNKLKKLTSALKEGLNKASVANASSDVATFEINYYEKRGHILYDLGDYEGAMTCAISLRKKLPNDFRVDKEYGDCLRKVGNYDEALKAYDDALKKCENNKKKSDKANILCSKGLVYLAEKKYTDAANAFEDAIKLCPKNPLFICNKGKALFFEKQREAAQECFAKAQLLSEELLKELEEAKKEDEDEMIKLERTIANETGLRKENFTYISETLKELNSAIVSMNQDKLEKFDPFTHNRESYLIEKNLEDITAGKINSIKSDLEEVKDIKERVRIIQDDPNLYCYYDGFLFTMNQSFATSVVINSDTVSTDTGDLKVSTTSKLISFIPFIGDKLSTVIDTTWNFYKDASLKKAASNVCKFASGQMDFEAIAQDAITSVIIANKDELKLFELDDYILPKWEARFKKVKDFYDKVNVSIYGERMEVPFQKAGYQTANTVIEENLASATIYEGYKPAIIMNYTAKLTKLKEAISKTLEKDLEAHRKKLKYDPKVDDKPLPPKVDDKPMPPNEDDKPPKNSSPAKSTSQVTPISNGGETSTPKNSKKKGCFGLFKK